MKVKKEEIKQHKALIETIANFVKPKSGKLISKNNILNGLIARFKPHKNEFSIEFIYDVFSKRSLDLDVGQFHKNIQIKFGQSIYNLESVYLGHHGPPRFTGTVDRISTKGYSEKRKYYYQLVIPLEKELIFRYNIEQAVFTSDLGYRSRAGTNAMINGEKLQVCCIHNAKKDYFLTIDSPVKQSFNEFVEKANAVKIAMGYLSGYFVGDQGFIFAYSNKKKKEHIHFRCAKFRTSIESGYCPVYSNAHGYLHRDPLAKKYQPLLRPVSLKEFSLLCEKIYSSIDFSATLMLMLESSVASLLFMPGGYAIALETISDIIIGKQKLKLAPIKDKSVSRKIRKEMHEVLNRNHATINSDEFATLQKRIDQLNQPTNKSRLKAPFDLLGINLLAEDLKILETRNDFLHGRVPDLTNSGANRSTERMNKDLYYCSIRFYTLLNLLILKWIGYDNRVVNLPKLNESFTGIKIDEEPFRLV